MRDAIYSAKYNTLVHIKGYIMQFKIGDKVEILSSATKRGVESEEVGKVGVVCGMDSPDIIVKMNEICKVRRCIPEWYVKAHMIKLLPRKNEQLLFNFMK